MSAQVDAMFSVRQNVWWQGTSEDHGQAHILGEHPSWDAARVLAGIDWEATEEELFRVPDQDRLRDAFAKILFDAEKTDQQKLIALLVAQQNVLSQRQVDGWKHIGRDDDDKATLACTMNSYEVINNSDFGRIFEAVLQQTNVKFETGGCLEGGKRLWMMALLDEPLELGGDTSATMPYVTLMSRHDAGGSTAIRAVMTRIVCGNTWYAADAEAEQSGLTYRFIHRGDWESHLEEAREAIQGVRNEVKEYKALATELLGIHLSEKQEELFVRTFFPMPPEGMATPRVLANVEKSRGQMRKIFASQTVAGAGVRYTGFGAVQGAIEYLDWARQAKSWETRLNRMVIRQEPLKEKALSMVREIVAA